MRNKFSLVSTANNFKSQHLYQFQQQRAGYPFRLVNYNFDDLILIMKMFSNFVDLNLIFNIYIEFDDFILIMMIKF